MYMDRVDPTYSGGPGESEAAEGTQLGVRQLIDILKRRWMLIALITVGVTALTIIGTFLVTPKYDATGRLKIDPTLRSVTDESDPCNTSPQTDQSRIETEIAILKSRTVAERVVRDLNLTQDRDFVDEDTYARGKDAVLEEALGSFDKAVDVEKQENSFIVNATARSSSPEKSARIVNALMRTYIDNSVNRRTGTAAQQSQFLDQRLRTLASEIQGLEARIASYRGRAGIVEGGGVTQGTVTDQQISPLTIQLAQAEAEAASARANLTAAQQQVASGNIGAVSSVLSSNVITELQRQRAEAVRDKAQIDARYGTKHPESIRSAQQLEAIDQALRDEQRRILGGLEASARSAEASAAALRRQLAGLRGEQAVNNRAAVSADALEREAKAKQAIYDQLAQTQQRTSEAQRNQESIASIVEEAVPPIRPSVPNKPLFAVLGAVLGVILGLAAALVVELLTASVRTAEDVEYKLRLPFLTSSPRLGKRQLGQASDPVEYVALNPMSSYAESLRTLRNTLMLDASEPRVVAVLSSLPGEAKTTTSLALGRVMAMSGDRAIVIDCDERRGGLGALIPPDAAKRGVAGVLRGTARLADEIITDPKTGLDLLPMREQPQVMMDLFSGEPMRRLIEELRRDYRFVILDTPPTLAVADSRIVAALADTSIFVLRAESTPVHAARAAVALLAQDGTRVLGGMLSLAPRARRLGTRDPSYYYERYRAYHKG